MSRITAIEVQKNNPDRMSIFVEGEFVAGVDSGIVLSLGLYVGKEIDDAQLQEALHRDSRQKAISSAIGLLGYRDRTAGEIRSYLKKKGCDEELIAEVIGELVRLELVDDHKFSRNWVENRSKFRPKSRSALVAELRKKGVDKELAESAVECIDDEKEFEMAKSVAELAARKTSKEGDELARYLSGVLARKGFSWEIIRKALEDIVLSDNV